MGTDLFQWVVRQQSKNEPGAGACARRALKRGIDRAGARQWLSGLR